MKSASVILAFMALVTGLRAAWIWYKSSQIVIDTEWTPAGLGRTPEPVDPELHQLDINAATDKAFSAVGRFNKSASLWTAASVALAAISSVCSSLTCQSAP